MTIKIIQWNIFFKEKIENITKLLQKENADIICLQELRINDPHNDYKDCPSVLAKALGMSYCFFPAQEFPHGVLQGNGILSKYPLLTKNKIVVQESKKPLSPWNERRIIVEATLEIENINLKVATTHLSYTPYFKETAQKLAEGKNLLDYVAQQTDKFVLTGDFNIAPDSQIIKKISQYLKHCGPDYKEPSWTTKPFSYEEFKEDKLRWRLDYAFTTPDVSVTSAKLLTTNYSDHLPLLFEIDVFS